MERRGSKVFSLILIATGSMLLAFWGFAQLHSRISSSTALSSEALAAIPSAGATNAPSLPGDRSLQPDTSLWSPKRIARFQRALRLDSAPPVAVLRISRIHLETPVFRGTDDVTLNRGLGWVPGTAAPGSNGNTAIAGHRDGFFRALKDIAVHDEIELRTGGGVRTFVVRDVRIVKPSNLGVLAPSPEPTLTLITCYPFYFVGPAPKRFIVRAVATRSQ